MFKISGFRRIRCLDPDGVFQVTGDSVELS
jgi:hypothetical protein